MSGEENFRCIPHAALKDSWPCHALRILIVPHAFPCVVMCDPKMWSGAWFIFCSQHERSKVLSTVVSSMCNGLKDP